MTDKKEFLRDFDDMYAYWIYNKALELTGRSASAFTVRDRVLHEVHTLVFSTTRSSADLVSRNDDTVKSKLRELIATEVKKL